MMDNHVDIVIRMPHTGDGVGLARTWLDIAAYYTQLNPDLFHLPQADNLDQWFEDSVHQPVPEHGFRRVAAHNDQVIGLIVARLHPPISHAARQFIRDLGLTRLVIEALVVQQAYWRHGIGSQLLNQAEIWGRAHGAAIVSLDTYHESPVSVPFYEQRMGYKRQSVSFRKELS